jgi:hypothetical protein
MPRIKKAALYEGFDDAPNPMKAKEHY